ncbi:MAG: patatin-like phospholipase family protein [Halanaerobiales bacterium]|nr:patatin-like phospholipase family protein [Halanaerobiales bacterium]
MKNNKLIVLLLVILILSGSKVKANIQTSPIEYDDEIYIIENYSEFGDLDSPKLALALSGGGARAFVNIGVIKALNEADIYPDIVIGSSMGGIISALYGSGMTAESMHEITSSLPYGSLFDINLIPIYSIFRTRKLNQIIEKLSPNKDLKNFPIKTGLLTYDLDNGYKYIMSEGKISEVLQSTYSIPFYYPITENKDRYLIDPGTVEMVPSKAARALDADIVIATTAFNDLPYESYKYPLQSLSKMLLLVQKKNARPILEKYSDIIIENDVGRYSFKDFDLIDKFIEIGYQNTQAMLPEIQKLLEEKNHKSKRPDLVNISQDYYKKIYTDILYDRIIYSDTYFHYLLYYFNNQSFFTQELFKKPIYNLHFGFYFEKSHFDIKALFNVEKDKHTELMLRYKKITDNIDLVAKLKNNTQKNNIDYIVELKYFNNNSSYSIGLANLDNENYYYLNNNINLSGGKFGFKNNTDILLNMKKNPQLINLSQIDYHINQRWTSVNKFMYSNTNLLGDPDIYRGNDKNKKDKTALSTSIVYNIPFYQSPEFLYFFALEEINPALFVDIEHTDNLNSAIGLNMNMVSSLMGLNPLNLDLSAAYDKNSNKMVYNFSVDVNF